MSKTHEKKKARRLRKLALCLLFLVLIAPLVAIFFAGMRAQPAHADVIVVPGAALRKGGRELSPALKSRMDKAIELWKAGFAPKLMFTGGGEGIDNEAQAMARYARAQGVPANAIWIEPNAKTTRENAELCAAIIEKEGAQSALVVSNWYHVARTRLAIEQAGITTFGAAADSPSELDGEVDALAREWLGLWGYALKADALRR